LRGAKNLHKQPILLCDFLTFLMKKYLAIIFAVLVLISQLSCDAPRLNPLDPSSPDYKLTSIEGTIKTTALPQQPIAGVKVFWKDKNLTVQTDQNGYYKLDELVMNDGILIFEKDGYSKDSVRIVWAGQKNKREDVSLNAIPQINKFNLFTIVQNRYADVQDSRLNGQVSISDPDNTIDTVYLKCDELAFSKKLSFSPVLNMFEGSFTPADLNVTSLDIVIGKKFELVTIDNTHKAFLTGSTNVMRIIKQEVIIREPLNKISVNTKPVLKWYRFLPGFNFKYKVEIYTDELVPQPIWDKENISKEDVETTPDFDLSPGEYYWVVWAVDDFQNRCRSKPASFVVK